MKLQLNKREDGLWQADVFLPDGRDFHAVGHEPWKALIELGLFWAEQPKSSDMAELARVVAEARKEQQG